MPKYNPQTMRHYKGNPNLKCAGVQMQYSADQIAERIKCTQDPEYFIETYLKIIHVDKGLVPFKLYDFQKTLLKAYTDNRFVIAKLPRQIGKSTVTVAYIMWVILFGPMQNIAILANKASTARDILGKLQLAYEHIPLWMQQGITSWNRGSIEIENGSKVVAASTAKSSIRGNTYNIIFLDEFGFVPTNIAEEFITSVYPTISSGTTTKLFMVSTPNGMNLFYKYWTDAVAKRNLYVPVEAHWSVVPGRDAQWAADQIKQLGQEKFNQEFNCVAGDTVIETSNGKETIEDVFNQSANIYLIYKITRDDGKQYIGTTIKRRIKHRMCSHKHSSRFVGHEFTYEVLEESTSKEYIAMKEEYYIQMFNTFVDGLNESESGKGNHHAPNFTTLGYKYSEHSRRKMSESAKLRMSRLGPPNKGKFHTQECKDLFSKMRKGKIHSYKLSDQEYLKIRNEFSSIKNTFEIKKSKNGKMLTEERQFAKTCAGKYNTTPNNIMKILLGKTLR